MRFYDNHGCADLHLAFFTIVAIFVYWDPVMVSLDFKVRSSGEYFNISLTAKRLEL